MSKKIWSCKRGYINKIVWGNAYYLKRAIVKDFNNQNYITLNRQTEITGSPQSVERLDDNLGHNVKQSLPCPPEGVQSVHQYLACKKCSTKMVTTGKKIVKCTGCGLNQLTSSCQQKIQAIAFFAGSDGVKHSVVFHYDILKKLFQIYNIQISEKQQVSFEQLTDDDIMEVILAVSDAEITCGKNNVAQDVTATPESHDQTFLSDLEHVLDNEEPLLDLD